VTFRLYVEEADDDANNASQSPEAQSRRGAHNK
jgi:hypothetical protein